MELEKANQLITMNAENLPVLGIDQVREKLLTMDEGQALKLLSKFKSPLTTLLLSIFLGGWAIDRFYIGQVGTGLLKLITFGGFGIWSLIDIFTSYSRTKKHNRKLILNY